MELKLGPEIISSYKRLAYKEWYALAEFVDNSTQSYFNNQVKLDKVFKGKEKLTVRISIAKDGMGDYIRIEDNSIGMSLAELKDAVYIGRPPLQTAGRSRYGLGLKTGASWFGDLWTIETKKLNGSLRHKVTVDVPNVAAGNLDLPETTIAAAPGEHGTTIEIRELNRKLAGKTLIKVKNNLRSLYRHDISKGLLVLKVNDVILKWDADIDKLLVKRKDGKLGKEHFKFKVAGKTVTGWAAVLEKGSRKEAGFSIIQSDRVIKGWPDSYRPATIFGDQEGGSNDLVNQRLFGELTLEGFDVSHTKDQILFNDGEQEDLEAKLGEHLAGLRQLALTHRKNAGGSTKRATDAQRGEALNKLEAEIESDKIQNFLKTYELPTNSLVKKSNESLKNEVVKRFKPDLEAQFNKTVVSIYLVKDMSPNDPYVIIESTKKETSVIVIINLAHPHWVNLTQNESILNFIRHCAYDGVAESKAYFVTGKIEPDTVKLIKDNLLRLPLTL